MKRSIKKIALGCAVLTLACTSDVTAQDSWNLDCFKGHWGAGAAAIYEQSCVQNFVFADGISTFTQPTGSPLTAHTVLDVKPRARWGFKVWIDWSDCVGCNFINATYKWLHADRSKTVGLSAFQSVGLQQYDVLPVASLPVPVITGRQKTKFDTAWLRFGHYVACRCDTSFYVYGGGRYVGAEIRREIDLPSLPGATGFPNLVLIREKTRFDGGGIELGVGGEHCLVCGFSVAGSFGPIVLFGDRSDRFNSVGVPTAALTDLRSDSFDKHHITKCVPGIDFRTGIRYAYGLNWCGCCVQLVGEAGWEMDHFWNILGLRAGNIPDAETIDESMPFTQATNFGTSGLYLSLSAQF